ncbi:glycoside hydrolase family 18 protein [Periconia macrospinosa]|uniref:chitinase n=1 Tax=Periconia macrospinosa TaxID=97972 RepID=A0A2V1EGL2_9PLEO|nr:glycoside hydrolase family 18 protein [Periconia macrospinosa]
MATHTLLLLFLAIGNVLSFQLKHAHHHASLQHPRDLIRGLETIPNTTLARRDDYTCAPGRPCKNGACCGESECGKFAKKPGTECPLKTCCSKHGFCGTTADYCGDECQSNCIEHPKPPAGKGGKVLDRVIGYWEAWNARSECHNTQAEDLPLEALTHVNYAFAYIDPENYEVTTMDAKTPATTFEDAVALKLLKPDLKVFVSIGGWTFSDNGTKTQPVFGDIARSSSNRQKFADNLLRFLNFYGYDGVDLDWEYPGAPDRGGRKDDTDNYVELLKTLREKFSASGRDLGITFTAPSSLWYLRWFDLPGMMKYADWVNLMSYDLHGVWDRDNPIGSIVQAHTNLTEIKLAVELFWRVDIAPSQIALGFGFYGRAFTLADPSCSAPGCPFSGGANKGVCTGESGYLAHYEIQDIIAKNSKKRDVSVIHDKEAAIKYLTWDGNQWISFDDQESFAQKKEWADEIGFHGSLIWASDLDDYNNTAHKDFTGNKDIGSRTSLQKNNNLIEYTESAWSFLGQGCKFHEKIVDVNQHDCGSGMELVGYDAHGCNGKVNGKKVDKCGWPMCCPTSARMKDKCTWRGSDPECNGQCHANEVDIGGSSWGGSPGESPESKRCSRGGKHLCCEVQTDAITSGCYWTEGCDNKSCKADEESVAHAYNIHDKCAKSDDRGLKRSDNGLFSPLSSRAPQGTGQNYCCKKSNKPFDECKWHGSGDCVHNTCGRGEVTLKTNRWGDDDSTCFWFRAKALCCTPNQNALNHPVCNVDLCEGDSQCEQPEEDPEDDSDSSDLSKRGHLSKRVTSNAFRQTIKWGAKEMYTYRSPYPSGIGQLFKGPGAKTLAIKGGYMMKDTVCTSLGVTLEAANNIQNNLISHNGRPNRWNTEHGPREMQVLEWLLKLACIGELPSGDPMITKAMDPQVMIDTWNTPFPRGLTVPNIGQVFFTGVVGYGTPDSWGNDWNVLDTPNKLFYTIIGSYAYRKSLTYLPSDLNIIKRDLMKGHNPMALEKFKRELKTAFTATSLAASRKSAELIMTVLQKTFGAVNYFNDAALASYWDSANRDFYLAAKFMGDHIPGWENFPAIVAEFDENHMEFISLSAQLFMATRVRMIVQEFGKMTVTELAQRPEHMVQFYKTAKFFHEMTYSLKFSKTPVPSV